MPNIWTHIAFCKDMVNAMNHPSRFFTHEQYLNLGAQGPDPFFYYNFWPWIKDEPVHDIGTALHTKHCGDFLMDLITKSASLDPSIQAYVFGFVTHHILDRNAHPYIHYRAGYEGNDHQRLEVLIDTLMMQHKYRMQTWKVPVYNEIDVGRNLNPELVKLLYSIIQAHYPDINPQSSAYIQKAYQDMKLALRILADPHGWKNKLLKSLVSAYSHQPIKTDIDYLNLKQTTWYHPATQEPSNQTFMDLYEAGLAEAIEIMTLILEYWRGDDANHITQQISGLIGDISYDTGKPLKFNLENKYSDPIV
ncbi:zinc dependent phospholipase C family protein [Lentibacillus sp. L22]|uniref:zinc dependent phospholipase C family protein n=1 Tax=Lentibacillus TaxID=175304 RepID=UPI0022B1EA71|nr:zinc dependent phospholipase C family protein [Lentibacillus daqui]